MEFAGSLLEPLRGSRDEAAAGMRPQGIVDLRGPEVRLGAGLGCTDGN